MADIYEQFDKATANIAAHAIMREGDYIGRAVFKYPRDGAGRQYCYLQVWGAAMARGFASGGGYDKSSAAFESAAKQLRADDGAEPALIEHIQQFIEAANEREGVRWNRRLEDRGYFVAGVC